MAALPMDARQMSGAEFKIAKQQVLADANKEQAIRDRCSAQVATEKTLERTSARLGKGKTT